MTKITIFNDVNEETIKKVKDLYEIECQNFVESSIRKGALELYKIEELCKEVMKKKDLELDSRKRICEVFREKFKEKYNEAKNS